MAGVLPLTIVDTERVFLGLTGSTGGMSVSYDQNISSSKPGFAINPQLPPLMMPYYLFGPLVNTAWFGQSTGFGTIGVFTVNVKPGFKLDTDPLAMFNEPQKRPPNKITTAPGVNGKRGILDYWASLIARLTGQQQGTHNGR
jgi:hypothetical protein